MQPCVAAKCRFLTSASFIPALQHSAAVHMWALSNGGMLVLCDSAQGSPPSVNTNCQGAIRALPWPYVTPGFSSFTTSSPSKQPVRAQLADRHTWPHTGHATTNAAATNSVHNWYNNQVLPGLHHSPPAVCNKVDNCGGFNRTCCITVSTFHSTMHKLGLTHTTTTYKHALRLKLLQACRA